jgi:hypothetical protein
VDALPGSAHALQHGKRIKIKGVPQDPKRPCFRVAVSTHRPDGSVTNALAHDATEATHKVCGFRWQMEQLHREGKQITGLERCQCRKARRQRTHIGCALLVWVRFKDLAANSGRTVSQLQHGFLDDDLMEQLKNPSLQMALA